MIGLAAQHALAWVRDGAVTPPPGFDPAAEGEDAYARMAQLFRRVFTSAEGEAVLQVLLQATLFKPAVDHRLSADEYLRFAQLREGQNSAVAMILTYLNHADERTRHGRPDPATEPGPSEWGRSGFYDGLDGGPAGPSG